MAPGKLVQNEQERRGFIIVIVLLVLSTVGMFCLIIALVVLKNKRDRRKREAKLAASDALPRSPYADAGGGIGTGGSGIGIGVGGRKKGKYARIEDEEVDGVWSVEMDERRREGGEREGGGYGYSG